MPNTLVERKRIEDILNSDAGRKRPEAAKELAFSSGMSAEAAINLLGKLPAEKAASSIESAMAEVGPLGVRGAHMGGGAGAGHGGTREERLAELRQTLAPLSAARKVGHSFR